MSLSDFQVKHGAEWNKFLRTDLGQAALHALHNLRMLPTCDSVEHQAVYRLGAIAGYEQAEKNLILFGAPPMTVQKGPDQNYGVKEKPAEK